jgi:hypothetical protein
LRSKLTKYCTVLSNEQPEKAWEVIAKLHADPNDPSGEFAREEFHQMSEQIARDSLTYGNVTILDMFRKPQFRKRMVAAALVMASSQLTGNLVIYSTSLIPSSASSPSTKIRFDADTHGKTGNIAILYKGLGLSDTLSLVVSGIYITWACVCNFINASFLDRFGRVRSMRMSDTPL